VELTRRQALRAFGAAGLVAALPACGSRFADVRLRIATGGTAGEYFRLGRALAQVWQERLGLATQPAVLPTNGSPANVTLLATGAAEVAVSQLDVAADRTAGSSSLRALAAVYNDAVQIVVPAGPPIRASNKLAQVLSLSSTIALHISATDSLPAARFCLATGAYSSRSAWP